MVAVVVVVVVVVGDAYEERLSPKGSGRRL